MDESHAGEYTCTPFNALGTEGPSPPIHVVVRRPPVFTVTPQNLYLRKTGDSLEIPCDALDGDGTHRPTIVWFKVWLTQNLPSNWTTVQRNAADI